MQNQNNLFYQPNLTYYNIGINERYNNFPYPYEYILKERKNTITGFASDEENINPNCFYFLTDKNGSMNNEKISNKLISKSPNIFSYSQSNIIEIYPLSRIMKKIENSNKKSSRKNGIRIINNNVKIYNNNSNDVKNNNCNLFNKDLKKCNKLKKKYSSIVIGNNLNENENISFYNNINSNSYSCYNHQYIKHNNYRIDNGNNKNFLIKDYNEKKEYKVKYPYDMHKKEIKFNSHTYNNGKCITITEKDKIYDNNENQYYNNLNKDEMINNKKRNMNANNNANLVKVVKNNKCINKKEYKEYKQEYKPPINKKISYPEIEAFEININKFKRINSQSVERKKIKANINISNNILKKKQDDIENIKNINLQNCKDKNYGIKNNHSFYEIKSISKDLFSQNNNINQSKNNNNEMVTIIYKNNKIKLCDKIDKEKIKKISYSSINDNICIKDKLNINTKVINFTKKNNYLKNKEAKPNNIPKKAPKILFDTGNKFEININYPNSIRENINTNNFNQNYIYCNNNNNFIVKDKLKQEKKNIIVKIDRLKYNDYKVIGPLKKFEKKAIKGNENKIGLTNKNIDSRKNSETVLKSDKPNLSSIRLIDSNCFSYFPVSKNNKLNNKKSDKNIKKNKKLYNKKNIIQLSNINKKTYEEDFPLNINNNLKLINNLLKPQISFRISLFGNKQPEYEKYFLVNTFFSPNMRDKPNESESDF